jgi:hypothetical protein
MKRQANQVRGRRQRRNLEPSRMGQDGRQHVDLARRDEARSIGSRMIVRIVLMLIMGILVLVAVGMGVTFMDVLLVNPPHPLEPGVRGRGQPEGHQKQHDGLLHATHELDGTDNRCSLQGHSHGRGVNGGERVRLNGGESSVRPGTCSNSRLFAPRFPEHFCAGSRLTHA